MASAGHTSAKNTSSDTSDGVCFAFHEFKSLPYELRRQIWLAALEDASPGVHFLTLSANEDGAKLLAAVRTSDRADSKSAGRTLGRTCRESRAITLEVLPDLIPLGELGDENSNQVLRFNGAKDIVAIAGAAWFPQVHFLAAAKRGADLDRYQAIQNLGIYLEQYVADFRGTAGYWGGTCGCRLEPDSDAEDDDGDSDAEECEDVCKREPLPRFLRCFIGLRALYWITFEPCFRSLKLPGDDAEMKQRDLVRTLRDGDEDIALSKSWPLIKTAMYDVQGDGWFVAYDERQPSPFMPSHWLEKARDDWIASFPYYKALDYLDIKLFRRI